MCDYTVVGRMCDIRWCKDCIEDVLNWCICTELEFVMEYLIINTLVKPGCFFFIICNTCITIELTNLSTIIL